MSFVKADEVPSWFRQALADEAEVGRFQVDGVEINYRAWGPAGSKGLILVHGGAAHAQWWDHVAPLLSRHLRVVAIDLSGHGDSGRRSDYALESWAREVLAVGAEAGIRSKPIIIGHSMGGFVALTAATLAGSQIAGIMTIDSPVWDLTPEDEAARRRGAFGPLKIYPSREAAVARFRPVPDQDVMLDYVKAHIAENSVRPMDGGWAWKFDPQVFRRTAMSLATLNRLECRVALFRAELGLATEDLTEAMYDRLGRIAPVIEIPTAGHAVMLDQPLALVSAIRALLADWEHSVISERPVAY
ncbi:pimeloyl-ACP methyl ester carboxylesterase [Jatrophihabitans sp. GAS493]|uniref:alpha/beta fold hydrolase n=1 Tax=Jatrophihabitans sp. GAS493 TaxID=1907575 RepID=UPI000BB8E60F|nr:alpha/beta hydrolase [Jatrophihabitans sp. GAS493]SOD74507.1 pimeloyl-ACP methyl ester carboxylesterase [Jatrophihabitans sp. GAS493]